MLTVGVLGTCRVHNPARILKQQGAIRYVHDNVVGFVHNSRELLQIHALLTGQKPYDPRFEKLINVTNPKAPIGQRDLFRQYYEAVDMMIVEVSSLRLVDFGGYHLQINRLRDALAAHPGGDVMAKAMHTPDEDYRAALAAYLASGQVDPFLAEVLSGASRREQTVEEIRSDVERIVDLMGKPVLLVSLYTRGYRHEPIRQRVETVEALAAVAAARPGVALFDPTAMVEEAGHEIAIKDLGHYKDTFEPTVAERLAAEIHSLAARTGLAEAA